jgi:hypothetical protein
MVNQTTLSYDTLVAEVTRLLAPVLGENMSRASARAQADKLQIKDGRVSPEQVEALLGKLGSGLAIFVGREKAVTLTAEMRTALARLGEAP